MPITTIERERHHTRLVKATHDAIAMLLAPFTEDDEVPGNIEDAVALLREGLGE